MALSFRCTVDDEGRRERQSCRCSLFHPKVVICDSARPAGGSIPPVRYFG